MMNRIIFADNPWPCGHAIKTLTWSARLDPKTGLWFDLHLVSDDYYAENNDLDDNANENYASDWDSKRVWGNYHRCILSSTYWGHAGFLVATENSPLDFDNLSSRTFSLDPLPPPEKLNERAFGIYLLGHDGVADHQIRFTQLNDKYFELDWHGKIALEYVGNYNFDYSFHARFDKLTLSEILLPEEVKESEFLPLLKRFVVNLESLI